MTESSSPNLLLVNPIAGCLPMAFACPCWSPPRPGWHVSFLCLLGLLLLLLIRHRFFLVSEVTQSTKRRGNESAAAKGLDVGKTTTARRRSLESEPTALGPDLGQLVPLREYLARDRLEALQALAAHYGRMRLNGTASSLGMELADRLLPGEVDMVRMDRESVGRLELQAIVDAMAATGPKTVGRQIRLWLRESAGEQGPGHGQQGRAYVWDVCLGQSALLCNQHLGQGWRCACQLPPQLEPGHPLIPCSALFPISGGKAIGGHILSVVLGFPLHLLLDSALPLLHDLFLAHWLALLLAGKVRWDQVLILRKACLSDSLFAVQFGLLREPASAGRCPPTERGWDAATELLSLEKVGAAERGPNWLWLGQAALERAFPLQLAELLPERMEQQRFFRQWIAQLPEPLCGPNWSYWSILRCQPQQPLFLTVGSLLGLGLPLGCLRFWHQMIHQRERQTADEMIRKRMRRRKLEDEEDQKSTEEEVKQSAENEDQQEAQEEK